MKFSQRPYQIIQTDNQLTVTVTEYLSAVFLEMSILLKSKGDDQRLSCPFKQLQKRTMALKRGPIFSLFSAYCIIPNGSPHAENKTTGRYARLEKHESFLLTLHAPSMHDSHGPSLFSVPGFGSTEPRCGINHSSL
jgi:hypothetical protein